MSHKIEIAVDNAEAEQFATWLTERGHEDWVGTSTGSYVDGVRTTDGDANETMRALWDAYCNA